MSVPVFKLLAVLCETEELRLRCNVPPGSRWIIQYNEVPPAEVLAVVDGFIYHKREGKVGKMELNEFLHRWEMWK